MARSGGYPRKRPLWLVNAAAISLWMNVLIIQHGWVNYALGVLWSLSVEEVFYLAFPVQELEIGVLLAECRDPSQGAMFRSWQDTGAPGVKTTGVFLRHQTEKRLR